MTVTLGAHTTHVPRAEDRKALILSGALTGVCFLLELGVGQWSDSVAVLSDAFVLMAELPSTVMLLTALGGIATEVIAFRLLSDRSTRERDRQPCGCADAPFSTRPPSSARRCTQPLRCLPPPSAWSCFSRVKVRWRLR